MSFAASFDSSPRLSNGFNALDAFDTVQAAGERTPLPAGSYSVRVVSGRVDKTRAGADAYRMVFEVTEGEHQGRWLFRLWTFSEKAIGYAKRDLAAFGLTTTKALLSPFPAAGEEIHLRVIAAVQRLENGTEVNDIKGFADILRRSATAPPADADGSPFGRFSLDNPPAEGGRNGGVEI